MTFDPEKHARGSIRLPRYDYTQPGAYFITICAADRRCIFGEIIDGTMRLNRNGLIAAAQWAGLPKHYSNAMLDEFVLMPNHVHGIICLTDGQHSSVGAGFKPALTSPQSKPRHRLPEIIRGFKTFSSRSINQLRGTAGAPVWQRNYYEHVVRGEDDLDHIRRYIIENPLKWAEDPENPITGQVSATRFAGGRERF
ncbi:MAG: transposase [Chloroflexi bacterium]|nr:transposase [Chloroflexota bacterium]